MNTSISIQVYSDLGTVKTKEQLDRAFAMFDLVVKKYTRFDNSSELSKLNKSNGKLYKVSSEFFGLIEYLLELSQITNGVFDPTVIDLLELYGYDKNQSYEQLEEPALLNKIKTYSLRRPTPSSIELHKKTSEVKLAKGQRIDLGSIGKGFAVDLAHSVLSESFKAFLINAGGDVRIKSDRSVKPTWTMDLYRAPLPNQAPIDDASWGQLELSGNISVAGSGGWVRRIKFFHHLLNPKTGLPQNIVSQTFTIADKAISADAWATILFLMGKNGTELASRNNIEYMIIMADGEILRSAGF